MIDPGLKDKVVLITGQIMQEIEEIGAQVGVWEANLADSANIPQLFDRAEQALGPVEILVNNAAHGEADTFEPQLSRGGADRSAGGFHMVTISAEMHDQHFAVNCRAVALMLAEFAPRHIEHGSTWGWIINVSADGASGFPTEVSYDASKDAMESHSRAAARELDRYGITVNIVSPGAVQTGWISPELQHILESSYHLRGIGQPEDRADVIVFWVSQQSRGVTGQLLYLGGSNRMPL